MRNRYRYIGLILIIGMIIPGFNYIDNLVPKLEDQKRNHIYPRLYSNSSLSYEERRDILLESMNSSNSYYHIPVKMYLNNSNINENAIKSSLEFINSREDCFDFRLNTLMLILYLQESNSLLSPEIVGKIKDTVLNTKFWFTEPGEDNAIYYTENHQALFLTSQILAGQLYKDDIFPNSGMTGTEHLEQGQRFMERWLDIRGKIGFTEWNSNIYMRETLAALINLVEYAENSTISTKAAILIDHMAFSFANNYYRAEFGTAHARASDNTKIGFNETALSKWEGTTTIAWLLTGNGAFNPNDIGSKAVSALSISEKYRVPEIIEKIAIDSRSDHIHKERNSISVEEGPLYGINYNDIEDMAYWWSLAAYVSPNVIERTFELVDEYNLDTNNMFGPSQFLDVFKYGSILKGKSISDYAQELHAITEGITMAKTNLYTYRTPNYQLSGVQDHQKGLNSFQEHIWQATLDNDVFVFTNSPSGLVHSDNRWTGGWMPRALFHENVGIIQYDRRSLPIELEISFWFLGMNNEPNREQYQHAYFPKWAFDQVEQENGWTFGKKDNGYIALYSYGETRWNDDYELVVESKKNAWIVELGAIAEYGSFESFINTILAADLNIIPEKMGYRVEYNSPQQGIMRTSWEDPLTLNEQIIDTGDYERYENKYCYQEFGTLRTEIEFEDSKLILDFEQAIRQEINIYQGQ